MALSRCLWYIFIPLCFWSFSLLLFWNFHNIHSTSPTLLLNDFKSASPINSSSLTAILPVTPRSLEHLSRRLEPLYDSPSCLYEILLQCPKPLIQHVKQVVDALVTSSEYKYPFISVHLYEPTAKTIFCDLQARISTEWVLMLDDDGLEGLDDTTQQKLLHPVAFSLPIGIHGFTNGEYASPSDIPQFVDSLIPPFITRAPFLHKKACITPRGNPSRLETRGILIPQTWNATKWRGHSNQTRGDQSNRERIPAGDLCCNGTRRFAFLMPTFHDLRLLLPLSCRLSQSFTILGLIYDEHEKFRDEHPALPCFSSINLVDHYGSEARLGMLRRALHALQAVADVVIVPKSEFPLLLKKKFPGQVIIEIPRGEFQYSQWMGSLTLRELLNWNTPRIAISIITQNRPWSLNRLLHSLSQSLFFGDGVDLRINLEQSADKETMELIDSFVWDHGTVSVHHRIIHGGLLPAIVESWYPHANHTYAVLLEDDIELSPLFYAWVKMTVLRYRYGDERNFSPQLFGISLYQQKNLELPMTGRRLFDPRTLFHERRLDSSTPYLSPVPCSWGALYFPNHWREFHDYITIRLSENPLKIDQDIAPNVRSNYWTKSWKKYFIELAFLRGYVMLYPNFDNYTSLSTNHLEIGSHVKRRTKEKQDLFRRPLMELPRSIADELEILKLPNNTLPDFDVLPVISLTGAITQLNTLRKAGVLRRLELLNCTEEYARLFDARSLMCIN